jgi:hypothetical protein
LSKTFLEQNSGKYLSCAVTATNTGGVVTAYSPVYLYFVQSKPSSPAVTVSSVHGTSSSGSSRTVYPTSMSSLVTIERCSPENLHRYLGITGSGHTPAQEAPSHLQD